MDTAALISLLRERDVKLWVDEDRLKLSAPAGALDAEMRATLASRKEEILAFLRRAEALKRGATTIVPIKAEGRKPPIFVVSGHGGDPYYFVSLARLLDPEQPLISVQPCGLDGGEPLNSIEALARFEIEQIRGHTSNGPYLIAGHCAGGILAFEVAQQLTAAGQEVALVALIGTPFPTIFQPGPQLLLRLSGHAKGVLTGSLKDRQRYIQSKLARRLAEGSGDVNPATRAARERVEAATMAAVRRYEPQRYSGRIDLFVTSDERRQSHPWRPLAGVVREHDLTNFGRDELLLGPYGSALAAPLNERLRSLG
jgi:thioesterase domain-containing protein